MRMFPALATLAAAVVLHGAETASLLPIETQVTHGFATNRPNLSRHEHAGRLRLAVIADRSAKSLETFALESVKPNTHITTDDWSGYDKLGSKG